MSETHDHIGTTVDGKYEIQRLIGRGGMGTVYAARQLQLDRIVAVKILRPDVTADSSAVARFRREARAAARIEHPNAVRVYDFGEMDDRTAYIVMEFVEGVPLRVMLRRTRILPLDVVLEIMWQAALATAAAHAQGIVHRDLKPENLIARVGDDGALTIKVVDFGLAKLLSSDSTQLTSPADMIGTPKYMAPEQFTGEDVDERVDVYALGVVLFEMLAGRPPFEGTFPEVVGKHLHVEPPSFESLGARLPEGVERVVRRALAKDPRERQLTPMELARDLARALGVNVTPGTSIIAPPSETSRTALIEAAAAFATGADPKDPDEYVTQYSTHEPEETVIRSEPTPTETERLGTRATTVFAEDEAPTVPPVGPSSAASQPRRARWPTLAALGAVVVVGTLAAAVAVRPLLQRSAPPSPAVAAPPPTPPPARPDPAEALDSHTRGIPFYMKGKLVIYGDDAIVGDGAELEVFDPQSGQPEVLPLTRGRQAEKWVVRRTARSTPGGLRVVDLVPAGKIVEMRIRRADGTVGPRVGINWSDE